MNTPPTILQVLPALESGGVERGTIEITRALAEAGAPPLVASAGGRMEHQVRRAGGTHMTLPLNTKSPLHIWQNAGRLEALIREKGVELIHARSRAPAWSAWLAARRTGIPFITTFHGTYNIQNNWKRYYNSIMTRGERVIAVSHFIAEHIRTNYTVEPERLVVIPRGVDIEAFDPERINVQRMVELENAWRVPEGLPVLLMPARFTRWKGHEFFLQALAALPHRRFMAILLGDDSGHTGYRKELEDLAVTLGLEGHVRLAHATPHMPEAYYLAHLVVAPSLEPEAFGRISVEAQAMGKPVIATAHGGFTETVRPGETGWLVPHGEVEALTQALDAALALSKPELDAMGATGMAFVRSEYTTDRMCARTLDVYEEVLTRYRSAVKQAA